MNINVGQYIANLLKNEGVSQSEAARKIGISRQQLSFIILNQRELSVPIALKMEKLLCLQEGKLLEIQNLWKIQKYKDDVKRSLFAQLVEEHAFWSYQDVRYEMLSDEDLVEKCLIHLDLCNIDKLFELYPAAFIKKVWQNRLVIQGDYLLDLNVMIAMYYFGIRHPESYLKRKETQYFNKIIGNA